MKQHSSEEIEGRRSQFRAEGLEEIETTLSDGTKLTYFIMPQSREPALPNFAYQCANKGIGVFGVSDSVPKEFRKYVVFHEVTESRNSPLLRCSGALEKELALVTGDFGSLVVARPYVKLRRDFFRDLVNYVGAGGHDTSEFQDSLEHLEGVLRGE